MNTVQKTSGVFLATAAAALLISGCAGSSYKSDAPKAKAKEASVKCSGINACKGQSGCATATTSCKGHNACKGTGWIETTAEECKAKGGKAV